MQFAQKEHAIRERAYAIWEQEGRPDGREWDHWERASREVGLLAPASQAAAKGSPLAKTTSLKASGGRARGRRSAKSAS
jgi:hypothetical protein